MPEFISPALLFTTSPDEVTNTLLTCKNWQEKYRQIMLLGKRMPRLPDTEKTSKRLVTGCESDVWLWINVIDGRLQLAADSDSKIVRGLLGVVIAFYQQRDLELISEDKRINYFEQMDLLRHLSPSRNNGIHAIVQTIDAFVEANLKP